MKKFLIIVSFIIAASLPAQAATIAEKFLRVGGRVTTYYFLDNFTGDNDTEVNSSYWAAPRFFIEFNKAEAGTNGLTIACIGTTGFPHISSFVTSDFDVTNNFSGLQADYDQYIALSGSGGPGSYANTVLFGLHYNHTNDGFNYFLKSYDGTVSETLHYTAAFSGYVTTMKVEFDGSGNMTLYINGAPVGGPYTPAATFGSSIYITMVCAVSNQFDNVGAGHY